MSTTLMTFGAVALILFARYQFRRAHLNRYDSGIQVIAGLIAFLAALALLGSLLATVIQ